MKSSNKKGQITLFIILGIIIVSAIAIFFLYVKPNFINPQGGELNFQTCVKATVQEKINELGLNDFSLITDGSLHIRQALIPECTKKEIKLPHYYYSFFDIRNEFRKFAQIDQKINNLAEIENCKWFFRFNI